MSPRRLLFWAHLTCGVIAGVVILVMSVTGVLLTYQRQITAWYDMHAYGAGPPSPGAARLSIDALGATAAATVQTDGPMTVTIRADAAAPASVAAGQRTIFINPYTGAVLGEGATGVRAFFRRVTDWHRWLGASNENRATARLITGAANLAFFLVVLSGPILWWPKKRSRTQFRNVTWFKRGLPAKARDFNWHNTIGIWSAIPLVVVVGSGVVMSYPWANNLVYRLAGEQPPVQAAAGGPGGPGGAAERGGRRRDMPREDHASSTTIAIDPLIARAAERRPAWRTMAIRLPLARGPIAITVDEGDGGQPQKRGTLTLDPATGSVVKWESQATASAGRRARTWLRFAHTGEVYGLTGQTIAGLASLGGVVLVWTGIALALRRLVNWRVWKAVRAGRGARVPTST